MAKSGSVRSEPVSKPHVDAPPATWFFLTEEARVGVDLDLNPTVSVEKLKEAWELNRYPRRPSIAGEWPRTSSGSTTRCGIPTSSRLLRRPAGPNIGTGSRPASWRGPRDALLPPAGQALEKAAEPFDTLDQVREQLARTRKHRGRSRPDSWRPTGEQVCPRRSHHVASAGATMIGRRCRARLNHGTLNGWPTTVEAGHRG